MPIHYLQAQAVMWQACTTQVVDLAQNIGHVFQLSSAQRQQGTSSQQNVPNFTILHYALYSRKRGLAVAVQVRC